MSVKVYFECHNWYAELVAVFDSEDLYMACLDALEAKAKDHHFDLVTESVDETCLDEIIKD